MNSIITIKSIKSIKYISLKKDFFKRIFIRALIWNLPCKKKWIEGVIYDSKNQTHRDFIKIGCKPYLKEKMHQRRQKGVVGCWIAHSHALEDITERDGISVILEDDFVCQIGFFKKAIEMIQGFNHEFDLIIFDPHGSGPLPEHKLCNDIYNNNDNGITWPVYWGSHCLFIMNKSVPKILNIKHNSQISDYDGFLVTNTELKVYLFYSHMSTAVDFGSNILRYTLSKKIYLKRVFHWLKLRFSRSAYTRRVY